MDGCSRLSEPRTEARPAVGQTAAVRPVIRPPAYAPPSGSHLSYRITRFQTRGSEARGPMHSGPQVYRAQRQLGGPTLYAAVRRQPFLNVKARSNRNSSKLDNWRVSRGCRFFPRHADYAI